MHPSRYPFVLNGPPCACGHRRVSHVGNHPRYEFPAHDLGCSECEPCENYTPVEAIDREAEALQRDEIREAEARRTAVHRQVIVVQVVATVIMVPMVAWEPGLFPWLIVPILLTGVTNMGVAALAQCRRGELESFDAMIEVGLAVAVMAFLVALVVGLPPPLTAALPVVALSLGFVFALRIKREMKHMTRGFDVMVADLKDQLGDES